MNNLATLAIAGLDQAPSLLKLQQQSHVQDAKEHFCGRGVPRWLGDEGSLALLRANLRQVPAVSQQSLELEL